MIRHGMELWLKCVISNRYLDHLLKVLIRSKLNFTELCGHEVMAAGRSKRDQKANRSLFKNALCIMRNVLLDNLAFPECRRRRLEERYADQALDYLRENPGTPRQRIGNLFVPVIGGHDLMDLWEIAECAVDGLYVGARQHERDVGDGPPLDLEHLRELCVLLHHFDPDGDALRYPFSIRGNWHTHEIRLSMSAIGKLASDLTASTMCFAGYRSDVYVHTTVEDPEGWLYTGYDI